MISALVQGMHISLAPIKYFNGACTRSDKRSQIRSDVGSQLRSGGRNFLVNHAAQPNAPNSIGKAMICCPLSKRSETLIRSS